MNADINVAFIATMILITLAVLYLLVTRKLIIAIIGVTLLFIASSILLSTTALNFETFLFLTVGAMTLFLLYIISIKIQHVEKKMELMEE